MFSHKLPFSGSGQDGAEAVRETAYLFLYL